MPHRAQSEAFRPYLKHNLRQVAHMLGQFFPHQYCSMRPNLLSMPFCETRLWLILLLLRLKHLVMPNRYLYIHFPKRAVRCNTSNKAHSKKTNQARRPDPPEFATRLPENMTSLVALLAAFSLSGNLKLLALELAGSMPFCLLENLLRHLHSRAKPLPPPGWRLNTQECLRNQLTSHLV